MQPNEHYLKVELDQLIATDPSIWSFIQKASLDGIWYWDLENQDHEWMSPEFWRLFGVNPETKSHDPVEWQDLINPDDLKLAIENLSKHLENPDYPYDQIVRYRHSDGRQIWVRCRGLAIRNDDGKATRLFGAHTDITSVKLSEELLRKSEKALVRAIEKQALFVRTASHDLKSPLRQITLLAEMAREALKDGKTEEANQKLEWLAQMAEKASALTSDILTLAEVTDDEEVIEITDVKDVIVGVVNDTDNYEPPVVAIEIADGCEAILSDKVMLYCIMSNLFSNARKYAHPDRTLQVTIRMTQSSPDKATLMVEDNGIGFDSAEADRIFDPFYRTKQKVAVEGTGVGLAICRQICERLDWKINATGERDGGATFSISGISLART